jgi:2-haloacid dehalogenase
MAAIDNVVFDIGKVLIRWEPMKLYRRMFPDDAAIGAFLEETGLLTRNIEFDRGEPFADGLADLAARHPHHAAPLRAFDERWTETLDGDIPETVALLEGLRQAGVPTYAITNFSREKFDVALDLFPYLDRFEDIIVSADVRLIKPDPEIFQLLIRRQELDPARCLFIDDSAKNIAAARGLGLVSHHYTAPEPLYAECRALGLPMP